MGRRNVTRQIKYRNPEFMQGRCAVCRKRPRVCDHPFYPSMCNSCRENRTSPILEETRAPEKVPIPSRAEILEIARDAGITLRQQKQEDELAPRNNKDREALLRVYEMSKHSKVPSVIAERARIAKLLGLEDTTSCSNFEQVATPPSAEELKQKVLEMLG